jgi:hypothetical protein
MNPRRVVDAFAARGGSASALLACGILLGGCFGSSSNDQATFDCGRGFRLADRNSSSRLKAGQSIKKCGWLNGWSATRVRQELGPRDFGTTLAPEYVLPGGDASKHLQQWLLKLRFDAESHKLERVKTETMPV